MIKLNHNNPMDRAVRMKPTDVVDTNSGKVTRVVDLEELEKAKAAALAAGTGEEPALKLVSGGK